AKPPQPLEQTSVGAVDDLAHARHSHPRGSDQPLSLRLLGAEAGCAGEFMSRHTRRKMSARFTSWMALVTSMPRGQASVQLKVVRQRQTPSLSFRTSRRWGAPWSRASKMERWELTVPHR